MRAPRYSSAILAGYIGHPFLFLGYASRMCSAPRHKKTNSHLAWVEHRIQFLEEVLVNEPVRILLLELLKRLRNNPKYSLRAFARDLGLDSGHLRRILSGERKIRKTTARTICDRLNLPERSRAISLEETAKQIRRRKRSNKDCVATGD